LLNAISKTTGEGGQAMKTYMLLMLMSFFVALSYAPLRNPLHNKSASRRPGGPDTLPT